MYYVHSYIHNMGILSHSCNINDIHCILNINTRVKSNMQVTVPYGIPDFGQLQEQQSKKYLHLNSNAVSADRCRIASYSVFRHRSQTVTTNKQKKSIEDQAIIWPIFPLYAPKILF